jgi:hypothetical protein
VKCAIFRPFGCRCQRCGRQHSLRTRHRRAARAHARGPTRASRAPALTALKEHALKRSESIFFVLMGFMPNLVENLLLKETPEGKRESSLYYSEQDLCHGVDTNHSL